MNPALMNYLQNNQSPNQMTGGQSQVPVAKPGQDSYNPFDAGIQKAISSARESLGMTAQQEDRALRGSMLTFADNMAQQPREKGFFNNFASVGRALSPAIQAHDQSEEAALTQNNALANQILAYQAAEQQRQAQQEERLWHRKHAENQLGEQRRYHNMMSGRNAGVGQGKSIEFGERSFRPLDKIEQRQANKFKKSAGNTYLAVKEINKSWKDLEDLTKNNTFQPVGGYSGLANPVKDFFGKFGKKKSLKKETAARKDLGAKLGNLTAVLESVKAGGGKLGQGMYDRLKPNFPDLANDDYETVKAKMASINKEMNTYYKAAKISADYGINIDPNDIDEMENEQLQGEQNAGGAPAIQPAAQEESIPKDSKGPLYVIMVDPDTGEEAPVHRDDVARGIKEKGLVVK